MTLLEKLIEKQKTEGLSDKEFAKRLDISRQLWAGTRTGHIPLGMKVLAGVAREFPSLADDVLHTVRSYNLETSVA